MVWTFPMLHREAGLLQCWLMVFGLGLPISYASEPASAADETSESAVVEPATAAVKVASPAETVSAESAAVDTPEDKVPSGDITPAAEVAQPENTTATLESTAAVRDLSDRGFPAEWIEQAERRWTFPGEIREHLLDTRHGFTEEQLADLTDEELINLHSNHHAHDLPPIGRKVLHPELADEVTPACAPEGHAHADSRLMSSKADDCATRDAEKACAQQTAVTAEVLPDAKTPAANATEARVARPAAPRPAYRPAPVRYTPTVRTPQSQRMSGFAQRRVSGRGR